MVKEQAQEDEGKGGIIFSNCGLKGKPENMSGHSSTEGEKKKRYLVTWNYSNGVERVR